MTTYKLIKNQRDIINSVQNLTTMACIPFAPTNRDYRDFKEAILTDAAELQDADGVLMTADDAKALENVVDMKEISASAIARLLVDFGYDVKPRSISKHRKRGQVDGCRCVKK